MCKAEEASANKEPLSIEIGKFKVPVNADTDEDVLAKTCRVLMTLC